MSTQKDNGGGCLLFALNLIFDIINNRRLKKHNKQARGLLVCESITTDTLFPPESYLENIIVSGGESALRAKFCQQIISNCVSNGRPMIILHLSNTILEDIITQNNWGVVASDGSKTFDAFTSFDLQEICQIVFDIHKAKYDIKPAGRYILQIVYELLTSQKCRPYFVNYVNFPFNKITEKIDESLNSGFITQDQANNLNSLLMMGQSEIAKIDSFFCDMKAQMNHISTFGVNQKGGTSIIYALKKGKNLCIDLKSSANNMLVELVVNSLIIAMNRGFKFALFIDDIAIANNESLKNTLCQKSNHNNIIFSKDLYALLNGKDDVFTTLVGESEKTVLLSHGSNLSCEKWSKYIGEYEKIDVQQNTNAGWSQSSRWGYNTNRGQAMIDKREYKVKPEQIKQLYPSEVFVYDNKTGKLMQTVIG